MTIWLIGNGGLDSVAVGVFPATGFAIASSDTAVATSGALIVHNSATGGLFYNQNGADAGFGTGAQFATLTGNSVMSATDFIVHVCD